MASLEPLRSLGQPLAGALMRRAARLSAPERHPLVPAAVRVERTRARRGGDIAEQTAVTLWFGEGPQLPAPGLARSPWRTAAGLGATLAGAAALAVASTVAAQREERRRIAPARPIRTLAEGRSVSPGGRLEAFSGLHADNRGAERGPRES